MMAENKELLIRDLCARLRYGVICSVFRTDDTGVGWRNEKLTGYFETSYSYEFYFGEDAISIDNVDKIKPYLRPMSSMTEEEKREYKRLVAFTGNSYGAATLVDWLNKKMFAYRCIGDKDMFELGLAIKAPEGMYEFSK